MMSHSDPVEGLRPGMRAVVRRQIEHGVTDALGDVESIDADTISVRTRRGVVVIPRAVVVAAKEVPPRSTRRGAPHLAISMDDLERITAEGWQPLERAELGDWILRASAGFTRRANSVLPLGNPGLLLSEAVDYCEGWYDARGLRPLFSLFGPVGFAVDDDPLGRELLGRGYEPFSGTVVLTAAIAALPPERPHASDVRAVLESAPSQPWWEAWTTSHPWVSPADEVNAAPDAARTVLTGSSDQLFASLKREGVVDGVARVAFARAWAGVSALHVAPEHRRSGVAVQLMGALADSARAHGIRSMYVQVTQGNSPALSLFERLGFRVHHEYRYLGV